MIVQGQFRTCAPSTPRAPHDVDARAKNTNNVEWLRDLLEAIEEVPGFHSPIRWDGVAHSGVLTLDDRLVATLIRYARRRCGRYAGGLAMVRSSVDLYDAGKRGLGVAIVLVTIGDTICGGRTSSTVHIQAQNVTPLSTGRGRHCTDDTRTAATERVCKVAAPAEARNENSSGRDAEVVFEELEDPVHQLYVGASAVFVPTNTVVRASE